MSKKERKFLIEFAAMCLQGEIKSFSKFYDTTLFSVEYKMYNDHAVAFLITPDEKQELATIYIEDAAYIIQHAIEITNEPFMALVKQYQLTSPQMERIELNETDI